MSGHNIPAAVENIFRYTVIVPCPTGLVLPAVELRWVHTGLMGVKGVASAQLCEHIEQKHPDLTVSSLAEISKNSVEWKNFSSPHFFDF